MQCLVFKKLREDSWMSMSLSQVIQGILCQECASIWQQNRYISNLKKYLNKDSLVNWAVLQTHLSPNVLALCSKVSVLCYDIYLSVFFITCLLEAHTHHLISYIHLMLITLTSKKQKNEVKNKGGIKNTASFNNNMYWDCCNLTLTHEHFVVLEMYNSKLCWRMISHLGHKLPTLQKCRLYQYRLKQFPWLRHRLWNS